MEQHVFWIMSRAAGTVALLASSAAVGLGLAMAMRLFRRRAVDLRATHEALSLVTIGALVLHVVTLLGDAFLKPGVFDLAIPFVSGYKEPWMSIGIVSGWAILLLGLSFYARRRIGPRRWCKLHRFTALAWVGAVVHSLGEGTDAGLAWFVVSLGVVGAPALVLLALRYRVGGIGVPS